MVSNSSYSVMCYQQYSMEKNKCVRVQGNIIKVDLFGSVELVYTLSLSFPFSSLCPSLLSDGLALQF